MHLNSMELMIYFRDKYLFDKSKSILDIGSCQYGKHVTYRSVFIGYDYTGMDIVAGKNVDIVGYENIIKKYDAVISGQVMEHIARPWEWIKQITQYTMQYICIVVPHTFKEHRYPIDTFRYFPDGMRSLFEYASIKELEIFIKNADTIGIGEYHNL